MTIKEKIINEYLDMIQEGLISRKDANMELDRILKEEKHYGEFI